MNVRLPVTLAAIASVGALILSAPLALTDSDDPNLAPGALSTAIAAQGDIATGVGGLGTATIPGDPSSFGIALCVTNDHTANITEVVFEPFTALGHDGLIIETATGSNGVTGAVIQYPLALGRGPVVVSFSDFQPGETYNMGMDPDTHDDTSFGATVQDMAFTRVSVAYSDGARGVAILRSTATGSTGTITRIDP